jgi:hypothetical protein
MNTVTPFSATIAVIAVLLGLGRPAHAQTPPDSLPNLSLVIGERIEVTGDDGSVVTGRVIRVSDTSLVLEIDRKTTELAPHQIRAISRWEKDSVTNGILIGTGLGFLVPAFISAAVDTGEPGEAAALLIPPGVCIGLAVGWIVDALRHKKIQIFPAIPARVTVAPLLGHGRKGIEASLRF